MKKLVFFGGTFDPPHNEHIAELKAALIETGAEKAIVMPTFIPPHKETFHMASAENRLGMCRLAFGDISGVTVSDEELKAGGRSYSYITIDKLKEQYSDYEILFLMGTDMLSSFGSWKNPHEILKNATPLLCERTGDREKKEQTLKNFKKEFGKDAQAINYIGKELSSTEIKLKIMLGISAEGELKNEVLSFIEENSVYPADKYFDFVRKNEKPKRVEHTLGVMLMAKEFAKRNGADVNKALLAALLHDCGKYLSVSDYRGCEVPEGTPEPVAHQYLGAYVAEKVLGVSDEEIIDAIRYHTTGKENMTLLGKIIFTADMLERGRTYEGVEELRKIAFENFEKGFEASLARSLEFVSQSGKPVCELTKKAYNYYIK